MRRVLILLVVGATALLAARGQPAAAVNAQLQVDVDTGTPGIQNSIVFTPGSGTFTVQVWAQNITTTNCNPYYPSTPCGLGGYTFQMTFDPAVLSFQSFSDGPFLRSTGRAYWSCPSYNANHHPENGVISVTCTTTGAPLGPTGGGLLASVTFSRIGIGSTTLDVSQSQLSDILGTTPPICSPFYTPCDVQNGQVIVNYIADLGVSKTAPASVTAPGNIGYTLQVTNGGPEQAQGVSLVDSLPPEVGFFSASPGCSYDSGEHKVNCDLGTLTNGQNKTINITASVAADQAGKTVVNQADVSTTSYDQVSSNNHAAASTLVAPSNFTITKTGPWDVALGGAGQYVIKATSTGSTATAAAVSDTLPLGVTYVNASSTVGTCSYDGGLRKVTCTLGDMAPSASATVTINVTFPNGSEPGLPHPDPSHPTGTYVANTASVTWTGTPAGIKNSAVRYTYVGLPDTDGDGCHDYQELYNPPARGGGRDPNNAYDFYDVPTPPIHVVGPAAAKDRAITGADLSALLFYGGVTHNHGPNPNGASYDEDLNFNSKADGAEYDYARAIPPYFAPDGAVNGSDLSRILQQGGNSCVVP